MNHYITYFIKPKITDDMKIIMNPTQFLLTQGKKGLKDLSILENTDRVTRLSEISVESLKRSTYMKDIDYHMIRMNILVEDINKFFERNVKEDCYSRFSIPKATGGVRWIDAPNEELMGLQNRAKTILENMGLIAHNNAQAYVPKKSITTNARFHQHSNHFVKVDFTKFFPSITEELLWDILPQIGILAYTQYSNDSNIQISFTNFLNAVINLATLKGSLPQGTPISPLLSNLIMIPFDYHMIENLKNTPKPIIYTRYADDSTFSSFYAFGNRKEDAKNIIENIVNYTIVQCYGFERILINPKKTTVSTKFGKNRITGIKVNGNNNLSIGYKEKQQLKKNLAKLIIMKKNGERDFHMTQEIVGYYNFLHAVEPNYARYMLQTLQRKFGIKQNLLSWFFN